MNANYIRTTEVMKIEVGDRPAKITATIADGEIEQVLLDLYHLNSGEVIVVRGGYAIGFLLHLHEVAVVAITELAKYIPDDIDDMEKIRATLT